MMLGDFAMSKGGGVETAEKSFYRVFFSEMGGHNDSAETAWYLAVLRTLIREGRERNRST